MKTVCRRLIAVTMLAAFSPALSGCAMFDFLQSAFQPPPKGAELAYGGDQAQVLGDRTTAMQNNLRALLGGVPKLDANGKPQRDSDGKLIMVKDGTIDLLTPLDEDTARSVLLQGYGAVDDECTVFFESLERFKRNKDTTSKEFALMGIAAGTLIAIAGPGLAAAGIAAAATGLAIGTTENIGDNILFAMDPDQARDLVLKAQQALANSPSADPKLQKDYIHTYSLIAEYARLCTPIAIDGLVRAELLKSKPQETSQPPSQDNQKLADQALKAASDTLKLKTSMSVDDAAALYLIFSMGGRDDTDIDKAVPGKLTDSAITSTVFDTTKSPPAIKLDKATSAQLTEQLTIAGLYDHDIPDKAAKLKDSIKPAAGGGGGGAGAGVPPAPTLANPIDLGVVAPPPPPAAAPAEIRSMKLRVE